MKLFLFLSPILGQILVFIVSIYSSHILVDPKVELAKPIVLSFIFPWPHCPYNLDFCESDVRVM